MAGETIGIIDLDSVLKPDIKVKLDGEEYKLPGDPPTEVLLSIVVLSEEMEKAVEADDSDRMLEIRGELTDRVEDLFSMRQSDIPEGFGSTLVDAQISELVNKLFAHYYPGMGGGERPTSPEAEEESAEEPAPSETPPRPRRQPRSRARSPRAKKTAASASSKSSTT